MERVLFGDNQFFGINHQSEEKARSQAIKFSSLAAITGILDDAMEAGIKTFMCTTHDRVADICNHTRQNPKKYSELNFYPCMPYAHKYANAMTEHGPVEALAKFLPASGALSALLKGSASLALGEIEGIGKLLIDAEMKMFHGLSTPIVFIQNILTDFCLGLGFHRAYRLFADHIQKTYNAEAGFITMNLPRLVPALKSVGFDNPIVCANYNKAGFRMCGGLGEYDRFLDSGKLQMIAMSVFASGALPPREALEFVCANRGVDSILFGASTGKNIRHTKQLIDELTKR